MTNYSSQFFQTYGTIERSSIGVVQNGEIRPTGTHFTVTRMGVTFEAVFNPESTSEVVLIDNNKNTLGTFPVVRRGNGDPLVIFR